LGGCEIGEAKITKGYGLLAKYIIHTVGPIHGHEGGDENKLLVDCYKNSFLIARQNKLKIIAFPCISTGAFGFPKDEAAKIAIRTAKQYTNDFKKIIFVCFSELDFKIYQKLLSNGISDIELDSL
jgi:O-acetyl-ADP-ribose deacetylase (regulator of RNase III)